MKVNIFVAINTKMPREHEENFLKAASAQRKGRGTGCMGSAASIPTTGARMQPILTIGTAMNALKSAIVCGLHKLTMCLHSYFPPERPFYYYYYCCCCYYYHYYLNLFFCWQYLTNFCTVAFLCTFSPTAAVFSLRGLHSMGSSAAGHRPVLQREGEINNQLEE